MIGVMNDTWVGSTVPDGHTDRFDWQVSHRALTHGPADDTPRESVNDDGEVQPALVGVLLRHIGHPQLIGPLCSKRPLYEVWSGRTSRVSVRDPFRALSSPGVKWTKGCADVFLDFMKPHLDS